MVTGEFEKLSKSYESPAVLFQRTDPQGAPPHNFIKNLAEGLKCSWGAYWKVDPVINSLRPVTTWNSLNTSSKKLEENTKSRLLSLSEGTAGHVWKTKKPVWTTDLTKDMCIPRSLYAEEVGLDSGIWFAIKIDSVVYGVVELLGRGLPVATAEDLRLIEQMGLELGRIAQLTFKSDPQKQNDKSSVESIIDRCSRHR